MYATLSHASVLASMTSLETSILMKVLPQLMYLEKFILIIELNDFLNYFLDSFLSNLLEYYEVGFNGYSHDCNEYAYPK